MPGYQSLPPTRFLLTHGTRLWPAIVAAAATSLAAAPADGERALAELADPAAKVRKVAADCRFTEGPAWSPDGRLLFSDIPNNRIVELLAEGALRDFLAPSGRANGLVFDRAGRLYACQGGDRRVVAIDIARDKKITVLADRHDGKKLNSPNDLALDGRGGLYFTDPYYGRDRDTLEQPVMGVYYIDAAGGTTRVIDSLERPNGILVSPDGKSLYVAEPNRRELYRFTITAPGKVTGKTRIFTGDPTLDGGGPDGMAHDEHGNIYATYKSVVVLTPAGDVLGRIAVPERPANCTFGGQGLKTLYITARTSLYAIDMKVAGLPARPGVGSVRRKVEVNGLRLELPTSWKQSEIPHRLRRFRLIQLEIPAVAPEKEPAQLVVYHFPGGAGGDEANVRRWIGQFVEAGRTSKTHRGVAAVGPYCLVEVAGTYNKPVGRRTERRTVPVPNARLIGIILHADRESYYLKLTGLDRTVAAARAALLAAIGAR